MGAQHRRERREGNMECSMNMGNKDEVGGTAGALVEVAAALACCLVVAGMRGVGCSIGGLGFIWFRVWGLGFRVF